MKSRKADFGCGLDVPGGTYEENEPSERKVFKSKVQ